MNSHQFISRPENYDFEFENQILARYQHRVPSAVFDSHFHLSSGEIKGVPDDRIFDIWRQCTNHYLGNDRIQGGLIMGNPKRFKTKEELDADRHFACQLAETHDGFVSGLVVRPEGTPEDAECFIRMYPKLTTLKPYRCYALAEDTYEADILSYAPEWMWELGDHYGMCIMIHLSHYRDLLSHPGNGEQLRYLCRKYPNIKVDLAHCALGHNPERLKTGLHYLEGLENIWMDAGGIGEALSILYSLRAIGFDRVMYASDGFQYAFSSTSRCFAAGGNFLALGGSWTHLQLPPDYQFRFVSPIVENLLASFSAGDLCGFTEAQWQDFFCNNAVKLHMPIIRK